MRRRTRLSAKEYYEGVRSGDPGALSRAITLVESARADDQQLAQQVAEKCLPHTGRAFRLGVTGSPGSGKSTLIEAFGLLQIKRGRRVGVLAVDPSSQRTKGSILGDKTRMNELSRSENAFVRPAPSGLDSGGVNRRARETLILLEAAGYDFVIVETVGVGQAETSVYDMVDFFMALALAGGGDELQGVKRGVVELADALLITKADGENLPRARAAKSEFARAMSLFPPVRPGWKAPVLLCSALSGEGLDQIAEMLDDFYAQQTENGALTENRKQQSGKWFRSELKAALLDYYWQGAETGPEIAALESRAIAGATTPHKAVADFMRRLAAGAFREP